MEESAVNLARYFVSRWTKIVSLIFAFLTLNGVTVAFSYESYIGDRLIKGHSIEDYISLALSHSSLYNTFIGTLFVTAIVMGSLQIKWFYNDVMKGSKFNKWFHLPKWSNVSYLLFAQILLVVYLYLIHAGNGKNIRQVEFGYNRVLTVDVINDTSIGCVSLLKEIAGFTYFYSLKREAVVAVRTTDIAKTIEDATINRKPLEIPPRKNALEPAPRTTLPMMRENLKFVRNQCS
ncbi:hypothetical protein [Alteromonas abrolhosensis]|uniref:hypothetical protein n=1 Tax=Alteromonas abrolhosensis TaxID=1892904 RepID=UPI0035147CD7